MKDKWTSLLMILLVLNVCTPSEACSCVDFHLQSFFCNWDFVIRGEILTERNDTTDSGISREGYDILVKKVYKGGECLKNVIFVSRMVGTSCEISYDFGKEDCLIVGGGSKTPDDMYVTACSYVVLWSQLSLNQIKGIQRAYTAGCNCTIWPCSGEECGSSGCPLLDFGNDENQARNQRCVTKNGACTWESIQ